MQVRKDIPVGDNSMSKDIVTVRKLSETERVVGKLSGGETEKSREPLKLFNVKE